MFETISSSGVTQKMFKKEMEFLVVLVILEEANESEWGAPFLEQYKT